ncbi:MAG: pyridoxal-phosphate dependent enzyme [Crocinitomicaceae bacterium]
MVEQELKDAYKRIQPFIHRTPVLTSLMLNEIAQAELFFKCENFQKTGSFKIRGATNAVLKLSTQQKAKGVVTHSSGNFAQALALAAKSAATKAYIVMPHTASKVKIEAVKGYGGEIILCEPTLEAREKTAAEVVKNKGATFLHPSNDLDVIYGQGTAAMELHETTQNLDIVVTPVGGGGLIAGTALASKTVYPNIKIMGGEPEAANDAYRSLISGKIEQNQTNDTIADGLRTTLGDKNFPIILKHVSRIITVSEDEIREALELIWTRLKILAEPSSAVALAAILQQKETFKHQKVGLIISGGNVAPKDVIFKD